MTEPSCPEEPSLKQGELEKALVTDRLVRDSDSTLLSGPQRRLGNLATLGKVSADFIRGFRAGKNPGSFSPAKVLMVRNKVKIINNVFFKVL